MTEQTALWGRVIVGFLGTFLVGLGTAYNANGGNLNAAMVAAGTACGTFLLGALGFNTPFASLASKKAVVAEADAAAVANGKPPVPLLPPTLKAVP